MSRIYEFEALKSQAKDMEAEKNIKIKFQYFITKPNIKAGIIAETSHKQKKIKGF